MMISSILKNYNADQQFTLPTIPKNWIEIEFINGQQQHVNISVNIFFI